MGEIPIFGLFFSYCRGGAYFRAYFVSYFGPKAQNLCSSRPSGSQAQTSMWVVSACADCPGFLVSGAADAQLPSFVQEPWSVPLD